MIPFLLPLATVLNRWLKELIMKVIDLLTTKHRQLKMKSTEEILVQMAHSAVVEAADYKLSPSSRQSLPERS
jgi:hypothetical protein